VTDRLGAQGTVLGGGRYDGLIETLGGPHTPAVGWAAGIERLAMLIEAPASDLTFAVVADSAGVEQEAERLVTALRASNFAVDQAYRGNAKRRTELARKRQSDAVLFVRPSSDTRSPYHLSYVTADRNRQERAYEAVYRLLDTGAILTASAGNS
jgi:histidyl-tRNA synthetase